MIRHVVIRHEDMPRYVEQVMEQAGLGDKLTRNEFIALHRRLVGLTKPRCDIHSVAGYVEHFPPTTPRDRVIITIATAIEEAALDGRNDSTHIDTVGRARGYLGKVEDEIQAMAAPTPKPAGPNRCQQILARSGYRRLGTRQR